MNYMNIIHLKYGSYSQIHAQILVIAVGFFGNLLVVTAAIRQKTLRTPRNAFIINLAVSDIFLCLVTMPLTLVEIVNDGGFSGEL